MVQDCTEQAKVFHWSISNSIYISITCTLRKRICSLSATNSLSPIFFPGTNKYRNQNIQQSKIIMINPKFASRMVNIINFEMTQDPPLLTSVLCVMLLQYNVEHIADTQWTHMNEDTLSSASAPKPSLSLVPFLSVLLTGSASNVPSSF